MYEYCCVVGENSPLMMAQSRAESTRDTYNYGQYLNQFPPNTIKVIREFERIQKRICRHKMSIMFNEICINEEMLPKYTYIYIYSQHPKTMGNCRRKGEYSLGERCNSKNVEYQAYISHTERNDDEERAYIGISAGNWNKRLLTTGVLSQIHNLETKLLYLNTFGTLKIKS